MFNSTATATRRMLMTVLLLSLGSLTALTVPLPQDEEEDGTRRFWNMQFKQARAKKQKPASATPSKPANQSATTTSANSAPKPAAPTPVAPSASTAHSDHSAPAPSTPAAAIEDELIGLTVWRLQPATARDSRDLPRLLVRKEGDKPGENTVELLAERVNADTPFSEGQRLRLGIEVPREGASYVYVIDREVYADGSTSNPYLIFPAKSTPAGDEVVTAGKITYVPSRNDPIPYFRLDRSRTDQVSELVTFIISPQPLDLVLGNGPLELDPALVAQWTKEWGGTAEKREARASVGRRWTVAEKEAGEGARKLVQDDPLPQTIYRVKAKPGKAVLVTVPLRIAR